MASGPQKPKRTGLVQKPDRFSFRKSRRFRTIKFEFLSWFFKIPAVMILEILVIGSFYVVARVYSYFFGNHTVSGH